MEVNTFVILAKNKRDKLVKEIGVDEINISTLNTKIARIEKVKETISKVLLFKKQEMKILEDVVNNGLKYVYPEKDLDFEITFQEKNNRIVPDFILNGKVLKKPFTGEGGGVISIIGLLIYITYIKLKNVKICFLDEAESMVDIEATAKLMEFLDFFSKENGISTTMITQKEMSEFYVGSNQVNLTGRIIMTSIEEEEVIING